MNTIKTRRELAQETALSYYDGDAAALIADVKAAGSSKHFIEGGGLAIYYSDQREELRKIFGETVEEAAAYSDEKVWANYINVMSDAISRIRMSHLKANGGEWL